MVSQTSKWVRHVKKRNYGLCSAARSQYFLSDCLCYKSLCRLRLDLFISTGQHPLRKGSPSERHAVWTFTKKWCPHRQNMGWLMQVNTPNLGHLGNRQETRQDKRKRQPLHSNEQLLQLRLVRYLVRGPSWKSSIKLILNIFPHAMFEVKSKQKERKMSLRERKLLDSVVCADSMPTVPQQSSSCVEFNPIHQYF